jgi:hypothetical protein
MTEEEALKAGMEERKREFLKQGGEIYQRV